VPRLTGSGALLPRHRTSLGIKATNGVVLATEKKMSSPLMDPTSVQKICNLTDGAGIVYSGMGPDFRVLVKKGRKAAQQYFRVYQVSVAPLPPSLPRSLNSARSPSLPRARALPPRRR